MATSSCSTFSVAGYCPGAANIQCCVEKTCSTSTGGKGTCKSSSDGCSGGSFISGLCPSDSSVECCVSDSTTCSTPDGDGVCGSTSSCTGFSVAGYCPGPSSNECCVKTTCSTPKGSGTCLNTSKGCSGGSFLAGYCPGDRSVECYVKGTTPPPTSTKAPAPPTSTSSTPQPTGNLPGFDLSDAQSADFWTCAAKTYKKIIIRGYFQACGEGGAVDTNLLTSYKAARAAGITNIDSYAFFCTGTQPTGVACKSPATQISEYEDYITSNKLELGHLWFDVEPASGECNAFNLGGTANEALAKEFTAIMDKSTHKWGIYGNGNTWSPMFPSRSTDIGSNLPLWAVQVDDKPDVGTVTTFMGGWTKAFAKQYDNGVKECSGANPIDLDTFSS